MSNSLRLQNANILQLNLSKMITFFKEKNCKV